MKTKYVYISALVVLGSTLAIARYSSADAINAAPTTAPGPSNAVWDGSDYVGQVNGQYYYLGPNNTWMPMDAAHQQRFEEWQQSYPNWNNPNMSTRSGGRYLAPAYPVAIGPYPTSWTDPTAQPAGIRNTRLQGHDMGQTHPLAPPQPTQENPPNPQTQPATYYPVTEPGPR